MEVKTNMVSIKNELPAKCHQHEKLFRLEHTVSIHRPMDRSRIEHERKSGQPIEIKHIGPIK
jgi:hypothetical protein